MKTLSFYNNFHKGDLHYSREFIKDIAKKLDKTEYEYIHNYDDYIFKDITILKNTKNHSIMNDVHQQIIETETHTYINTWIGQNQFKYLKHNCSLYSNYDMYADIYSQLNIKLETIDYYIPTIDYNNVDKTNIDLFIDKYKSNKKVLISNGDVLSGQALNFDFNNIISILADAYPDICFIFTDTKNRINKSNIFYTSDIININTCDLNEISYLSTFCNIIVGRASGAFCFAHVKENLLDNTKSFISFSNNENESHWFNSGICRQLWTNNYNENVMLNMINNEIKLK